MEIDRPSPSFRKVLRLFSLGLYFMMFVATVAAISWGYGNSSKLKHAQQRIEQLETELKEARQRLREASDMTQADPFQDGSTIVNHPVAVPHPLPPLKTASNLPRGPAAIESLKDRTIAVQKAQIDELERQLREAQVAAAEMARQAQEATGLISAGVAKPTDSQEVDPVTVAWDAAATSHGGGEEIVALQAELRQLPDDKFVEFLRDRSGGGGVADKIALELIRVRMPQGGDGLVASLLRRELMRANEGAANVDAHVSALEPYRTKLALDGLFAVTASSKAPAELRAKALWPLILAQDFRGAAMVGAVYAMLPPGAKERQTALGLAASTRDPGMLDAVLGALADGAATTAELEAAANACRAIGAPAAEPLAVLAEALGRREAMRERAALVNRLAAELADTGGEING